MTKHHDNADWDNMEWDEKLGEFVSKKGEEDPQEDISVVEIKDSNGNILVNGDMVALIKDLDVKGSSLNLKRGTKVKVKLGDDPEFIECKIGKTEIFLKTCFLKKT